MYSTRSLPVISLLAVGLLAVTGCKDIRPQASTTFAGIVKQDGFEPEIPPGTLFRPGLLYTVVPSTTGRELRRVLCEDITDGRPPFVNNVVAFASNQERELSASAGIELVKGLIKEVSDASLDASFEKIQSMKFKADGARVVQIADFPKGESVREIPLACSIRLKGMVKGDGTFDRPVYLVFDALAYRSMQFQFEGSSGASAAAEISAVALGTAKTGFKVKKSGDAVLEFTSPDGSSPIFVGTNVVAVKNLEFLSQIAGGERARVNTVEVSPSTKSDIVALPIVTE